MSVIPSLSILVAVGSASAPLLFRQLGRISLIAGFAVGVAIAIAGAAISVSPYPWTDSVVLLVALTGGVLLGRIIQPKQISFLVVLIGLSLLDTLQIILLTAGSASPGGNSGPVFSPLLYFNFLILTPLGRFNLGIFDILIIATMAEQWRRRGASTAVSLVPGVTGLLLADAFVAVAGHGGIPLIPFLRRLADQRRTPTLFRVPAE